MTKTYEVTAIWMNTKGTATKRTFTTTRKRDAIAKASDLWNAKLLEIGNLPHSWICVPLVSKVIDGEIAETYAIGVGWTEANGLLTF
jgi:hypothetical protein